MRVVVALGGNAFLQGGRPTTAENQQQNVALVCDRLAPIARRHELVISHGNGPQLALPAAEEAVYHSLADAPFDVLGAETQGMIGYLMERELENRLPANKPVASLLTMIEVDPNDSAFDDPDKPVGPPYSTSEAKKLAAERGWIFKPDGDSVRRVVASPLPRHIFEHRPIRWLLEHGCTVICAGGGGIPTAYGFDRQLAGVDAVIDKDLASALLAHDLGADLLIMATDTPAVYLGYGTPEQQAIRRAHPDDLLDKHAAEFASGTMLPKVQAACEFAIATGKPASIGSLADIGAMLADAAGTRVSNEISGVELVEPVAV
jgi:carbamate kinase